MYFSTPYPLYYYLLMTLDFGIRVVFRFTSRLLLLIYIMA